MGTSEDRFDGAHGDLIALDDSERSRAIQAIGKPPDVTGTALIAALPTWARWTDQIADAAQRSNTPDAARAALSEWSRDAANDELIAASIYQPRLHADMAGQLFVRLIEVPESAPTRALDDVVPGAFTRLSFTEAIAFFLSKRLITPDEFHALSDAAKANAFTATKLASDQLRQRAFDLIEETLSDGGTLDDFVRGLRDGSLSLGIEAASSGYLETVFRTNVQGAYGAGRLRQIQSDAVRAARPYVEYRTAGDNRVRASHAKLDRTVFRQDDPDWPKYAPPNGFNCRCAIVTLRESQVDRSRLRSSTDVPEAAQPDEGFRAAPTGLDDSQ